MNCATGAVTQNQEAVATILNCGNNVCVVVGDNQSVNFKKYLLDLNNSVNKAKVGQP